MTRMAAIETLMPAPSPLDMPVQDLSVRFRDPEAPGVRNSRHAVLVRVLTFGPALAITGLMLAALAEWLSVGGLNGLEVGLMMLVGMTFGWISLSVASVLVGLIARLGIVRRAPSGGGVGEPMQVALLVPVFDESPEDVAGNALAMLRDLEAEPTAHGFDLFILSDTRNDSIAARELRAIRLLRERIPLSFRAFYRRRATNTDRKTGNITDWLSRWGGAYDAMLVLDADSLMTGRAIVRLADELAADPTAGLIQTGPQLYGARTLFARVQQYANVAYGTLLAEGLALWSRRESNFWGHNAILRTRAFAACCGLPKLRDLTGRTQLILSHDFVEAVLLRRAGWSVRFLPEIGGSFEETPATLVDFALRDRRWCHGNMQHLRIVGSAGLHPISRFHLLHGAASYLLSVAWFVLLVIWAVLGKGAEQSVISYFRPDMPLYPDWPEMSRISSLLILFFMYSMLMVPKLIGAATVLADRNHCRQFGGPLRFLRSFGVETLASVAYAPVLMIQQTVAVLRSFLGFRPRWEPQQRRGGKYSLGTLAKFHLLETVTGLALATGMAVGLISLWMLPITVSLVLAVPLSAISGVVIGRGWLATPQEMSPPAVIASVEAARAEFAEPTRVAAKPAIAAE